MKNLVTILLLAISSFSFSQKDMTVLEKAMKKLKVETVLVANVEGIDEYPLWSPGSDFVACYIFGDWYKFDLNKMKLATGDWHDQVIGIMNNAKAASVIKDSTELKPFLAVSPFNEREVTTKRGTKIELRYNNDFTVSLVVTKNRIPTVLWTSEGENCHSPTLSPDGKFVAYICEMNGLMVMRID